MFNKGVIDNEAVLPEGWMGNASTPKQVNGETVKYGYMFWPFNDGAYMTAGIFWQYIYINPKNDVMAIIWGAQPKATGKESVDVNAYFAALTNAVK